MLQVISIDVGTFRISEIKYKLSAPGLIILDNELHSKASLLKGMSEFWEGEVSLVCRKIILIHSKGPGFCYLEDNRFK